MYPIRIKSFLFILVSFIAFAFLHEVKAMYRIERNEAASQSVPTQQKAVNSNDQLDQKEVKNPSVVLEVLDFSSLDIVDDKIASAINEFDERRKLSKVLDWLVEIDKETPVYAIKIQGGLTDSSLAEFAKRRIGLEALKGIKILDLGFNRITADVFVKSVEVQDYLKALLSDQNFRFCNITGNYAAGTGIESFFNMLTLDQLKKAIWIPKEWINGLKWVNVVCNKERPQDVDHKDGNGPLLITDSAAKMEFITSLKKAYNDYYDESKNRITYAQVRLQEDKVSSANWDDFPSWWEQLINDDQKLKDNIQLEYLCKNLDSSENKKELGKLLFEGDGSLKSDTKRAQAIFQKIMEEEGDKSSGFAEYYLSQIYAKHGDNVKADEFFKKSLEKEFVLAKEEEAYIDSLEPDWVDGDGSWN